MLGKILDEARTAIRNEDHDKVINLLNQAVRMNKHDPGVYGNRGVAWYHKNSFKKARKNYRKALILEPEHYKTLYNMAMLYDAVDDKEKAFEYIELAIKANPDCAPAYSLRGTFHRYHHNDLDKALKDFKKALKLEDNYMFNNNVGRIYFLQKRYAAALKYLNKAHKIKPDHKQVKENLDETKQAIRRKNEKKAN
jgi:Flp pilus assembly protein TadD